MDPRMATAAATRMRQQTGRSSMSEFRAAPPSSREAHARQASGLPRVGGGSATGMNGGGGFLDQVANALDSGQVPMPTDDGMGAFRSRSSMATNSLGPLNSLQQVSLLRMLESPRN